MHPSLRSTYLYIDTVTALDNLTDRMGEVDSIALDTEADSLYHYFEKVCLIQLSVNGHHYIVDPLCDLDLTRFLDTLSKKPLILHGGEFDLRMLRASYGFQFKSEMFDTMLAAQLLGYEALSLAALVDKFIGVTLPKQGKKSNWSRRPLSEPQLAYAHNDTKFLHKIAASMNDELEELGRIGWHRETCEFMVKATEAEKPPADPDAVWRIKGLRPLSPRQLAFVRSVWHWREKVAQEADLPPFKIVGNQLIIELSKWAASTKSDFRRIGPKLPRHITGRRYDSLRQTLKKARQIPDSELPEQRKGRLRNPPGPLFDYLRNECSKVAADLNLPPSTLASRATLESIAERQPITVEEAMECCSMMRWQAELLLPAFAPIMNPAD